MDPKARLAPLSRPLTVIAGALVAGLSVFVVSSKGAIGFIQDWAAYFWWLDYRDGLLRRGLAGQLFHLLLGAKDQKGLYGPLMTLDIGLISFLALCLIVPFSAALSRTSGISRALLLICSAPLFVSQLWPTLMFTVGYLDPLLLTVAAVAALLLRRGKVVLTGVLLAVGPLIHEFFVFLVPFVLAASLSDSDGGDGPSVVALDESEVETPWRRMSILGGVSVASTALVVLLSRPQAAALQFGKMALPADLKATILRTSMGQGLGDAAGRMAEYISAEPGFFLFNLLFFLAPALCACAGLLFWRRPSNIVIPAIQTAAALVPATAVFVAWDLSRFLVLTTITAGCLFLWTAEHRAAQTAPAGETSSGWAKLGVGSLMLFALAYGLYPFTYTYFGYRSFFQYFPPQSFRERQYRSSLAPRLEEIWGHQRTPFEGGDVSCKMLPNTGGGEPCAHRLRSGEMIFGPYMTLPLGNYRVEFDIESPATCTNPIHLEVVNTRFRVAPLVAEDIVSGGRLKSSLEFPVALDVARRGDFEFRARQLAGVDCAVLGRVFVEQLARGHGS